MMLFPLKKYLIDLIADQDFELNLVFIKLKNICLADAVLVKEVEKYQIQLS